MSESLTGQMDAFCYVDEPRSGLMNMAIDDAMLEYADEHRAVVLRLYQWSEPTLSLGYFQRVSDRELHLPSSGLQMVRRVTGGGAIVHHHDLTYSLAVPQSNSNVGAAPSIYAAVHEVIVKWLAEFGLAARQWRETYKLQSPDVDPAPTSKSDFLCFHRRSDGDVVVGDHKVMGSAQRRSKGALLQHGSLLIAKSVYAPSLCGLQELLPNEAKMMASYRLSAEEACLRIKGGIDALLGVCLQCIERLREKLHSLAVGKLARFAAPEWRNRV